MPVQWSGGGGGGGGGAVADVGCERGGEGLGERDPSTYPPLRDGV